MFLPFQNLINSTLNFLKDSRVLIAISGGVDSVVLAWLYHQSDLNFALAHCNFNLRGAESEEDEQFILDFSEALGAEVFIQNFDTQSYATTHKTSIQMAARELRYYWLKDLASQLGYDYILTGHHADDNLETFLINFTRGTGLNGLTGIPLINENVVRPLLTFSRHQIIEYAQKEELKWREDSSNSERKYLRNKLRHEVIPVLKSINPQLLESFQHTIEHLNDTADIVDESLNAVAKRAIVSMDASGVTYKISEFKKVNNPKAYLFEMFKEFGFKEWEDVLNLLDAESGKFVQSGTHKLIKHREFIILTHSDSKVIPPVCILEADIENKTIKTDTVSLSFKLLNRSKNNTDDSIYVDKALLEFPLLLRPWQKGDVFQPIGMQGKKKLSKFLKDEKLSPLQKQNIQVLTTGDSIIWVVGMRADDRFKVTDTTKSILKIQSH